VGGAVGEGMGRITRYISCIARRLGLNIQVKSHILLGAIKHKCMDHMSYYAIRELTYTMLTLKGQGFFSFFETESFYTVHTDLQL
jgi:hypothetical protein